MKIKAIIFDGDGTVWHYENVGKYGSSWDALSLALNVREEAKTLLDFYYPKKELYPIWIKKQAELFKGKPLSIAEKHLYPVPYTKGFRETVDYFKDKLEIGLLTGGLSISAKKSAKEIGFDFYACNELISKDGIFTGGYNEGVHLWKKLDALKSILESRNLSPKEICYVGDSKGDIPCMKYAGLAAAFRPKDDETRKISQNSIIENHQELIKIIEDYNEY